MNKIPKIEDNIVEDVLALECLFRNAGLELHSRAIRMALEQAQTDIIDEQKYGTNNIKKVFNSINNIRNTFYNIKDNITNKDVIDILENLIDDINNIKNIENAPQFVVSHSNHILKILNILVKYIKTQSPANNIDQKTKSLLNSL